MQTLKENKIAVLPQKEVMSVESFITQAISANVPIETLERLLAMRTQVKAEQAKEAFDRAMAEFQGDCPVIVKSKNGGQTNSGVVAYKYAPLDVIVKQTKELLKKNGFSYAIQTVTEPEKVKVTCFVKHELGHSESSSVEVPLGAKTSVMSAPQVVASALTFAKRYAFCNAFGILTGDEDTDAKEVPKNPKVISDKNKPTDIKGNIMHLLKTLGVNVTDKDNLPSEIKKLTQLDAKVEKNLPEIKSRLEILVSEME